MNLRALEWHKDVWEPEPGKTIPFEWADISRWFQSYDVYADEIRLCRWRSTYSISAFEGDEKVHTRRGIDRKAFENDPMFYIEETSEKFLYDYYDEYDTERFDPDWDNHHDYPY